MSREEVGIEAPGAPAAPSQALAVHDPGVALQNAVTIWAEANTRPETLARAEKLKDKVSAAVARAGGAGKKFPLTGLDLKM